MYKSERNLTLKDVRTVVIETEDKSETHLITVLMKTFVEVRVYDSNDDTYSDDSIIKIYHLPYGELTNKVMDELIDIWNEQNIDYEK